MKSFGEKMDSTILTLAVFEVRPAAICSTSRLEIEQVLRLSFRNSGLRGSSEDDVQELCVGRDGDGDGADTSGEGVDDVDSEGVVDGGVNGVDVVDGVVDGGSVSEVV